LMPRGCAAVRFHRIPPYQGHRTRAGRPSGRSGRQATTSSLPAGYPAACERSLGE
jgi:hypothetical protein